MADDQSASNERNGNDDGSDLSYDDDVATTVVAESIKTTTVAEDYVEEPIEDYVVNLVVNEQPEGGVTLSTSIVDAAITDIQDSMIPSKTSTIIDKINEYVTTAVDELSTSTPEAITGGKRWWGWSTQKLVFVGLIALCILAILIVILILVVGKKFKTTKKPSTGSGSTTATKAVVTKGISPDPKYQPVPSV
ncbi:unnamed protein product [Rotaria sp. Silwood2]|nr:unnamed protein product [Rotaria sp. Silwood2]CAF2747974.1 unnamed protein product [Rotaria sp. Silwood2]CAF3175584.1 unnamed protein product [Rotaria sp. Silwood2]CAF3934182.1 unnamed protein product [Rotaria sp. Silwood2]CAF4045292.1 unnamed protein product [Rotaria sp. Silwood2]